MSSLSTRLMALEESHRQRDHTAWVLSCLRYLQGLTGIREPAPRPRALTPAEIELEPSAANLLSMIRDVEDRRA